MRHLSNPHLIKALRERKQQSVAQDKEAAVRKALSEQKKLYPPKSDPKDD